MNNLLMLMVQLAVLTVICTSVAEPKPRPGGAIDKTKCEYDMNHPMKGSCDWITKTMTVMYYKLPNQPTGCWVFKSVRKACNPDKNRVGRRHKCDYSSKNSHWSSCSRFTRKRHRKLTLKPFQKKHCADHIWEEKACTPALLGSVSN
ncbi:hypothetical protein LSH36_975g00005 [Paralvinella palmiformis]|uniref:Pancreatic trypsin inhibitor n=1 Tax=Paralvinella palmiformis TaxID=53620 RepID=A0AAD9IXE5_9ANNE|nr:hypothetical protein LSH36_975g00005 [Paralvinella palmiformis]